MADQSENPLALIGFVLEGKYLIERFVAEGGFGLVYKARHLALNAPVALKILKTVGSSNEALRRRVEDGFRTEAKAIAQLRHPNIVAIRDCGVSVLPPGGRTLWMALDWLEGTLLRAVLHARRTQGRPFSPAECLELLGGAIDAIACAHESGVAHRDLTPSNIMLVPGRHGSVATVLDFGIAKFMQDEAETIHGELRTSQALPAFSVQYASPEQFTRGRTGPWTDVHALGLLLTEALTGCAPYSSGDTVDWGSDILSPTRPTPAKFGVHVGSWEPVLRRATALRTGDRIQSAAELLTALRDALRENAPVELAAPAVEPPGTPPEPAPPDGPTTRFSAKSSEPVAPLGVTPEPSAAPADAWEEVPACTTTSALVVKTKAPRAIPRWRGTGVAAGLVGFTVIGIVALRLLAHGNSERWRAHDAIRPNPVLAQVTPPPPRADVPPTPTGTIATPPIAPVALASPVRTLSRPAVRTIPPGRPAQVVRRTPQDPGFY